MTGFWPIALLLSLMMPALAQADTPPPPWQERAIDAPLSLSDAMALDDAALAARGAMLFEAKFTAADGAGRPLATQAIIPTKRRRPAREAFQRLAGPDASACSSCHNDPLTGGAGDFTANAFVSEGFSSAEFDTLDPQFSNERGTTHLFGAGLIELLAREMTAALQEQRRRALLEARASRAPVRTALSAKGVSFGALTAHADGMVDIEAIEGVDADLVIRPFSQKGVMTSLRQFTVNAANDHHGMQAAERFGARWTGEVDFDDDGVEIELSEGDVAALTAFQAMLPPPLRRVPDDPLWREAAAAGERRFEALGCGQCHRAALPLASLAFEDPGPYDTAGTLRRGEADARIIDLEPVAREAGLERDENGHWLVPLFGDLKRHRIADAQVVDFANELLAQRFVDREVFMTAELWGAADTAPYGHRGNMTTLDWAIRAHGGAARQSRDAYIKAGDTAQGQIIAFLRTLGIEP